MVGIDYFKQLNTSWGQIMAYASLITDPGAGPVHRLPAILHQLHRLQRRERLIMFTLPDAWVWDFWLVDDGEHVPPVLPLRLARPARPARAGTYRAVDRARGVDRSGHWERVADALVRGDAPAFDDLATWTGSVVRHPDGRWFMFYTGAPAQRRGANVQSIGYAVSTDLYAWDKAPGPGAAGGPAVVREALPTGNWHDEAFRDPWVFADPDGDGWHMLITARGQPRSDVDDRGVVGHAWSADLETLGAASRRCPQPGHGLRAARGVPDRSSSTAGRCCSSTAWSGDMPEAARAGGVTRRGLDRRRPSRRSGPTTSPAPAVIDDPSLYVGKFIDDRETGETKFLAFCNETGGHSSARSPTRTPSPGTATACASREGGALVGART